MKKLLLTLALAVGVISGCANEEKEQQQSLQNTNLLRTGTGHAAQALLDQSVARKAAQRVEKMREIKGALAVNTNEKLLLAYQVKHMQRFKLKQIEKNVRKELKKQFPDHDIIISSDIKLFWKTEELIQKMEKKDMSEKEIDKEISKIEKLGNELT